MALECGGGRDPEELKIIITALNDALIKYISPHMLLTASPFFDSKRSEFLTPDCDDETEIMKEIMCWILEDDSHDAFAELVNGLERSYETVKKENTDEKDEKLCYHLHVILELLQGHLLRGLTKEDICSAFKTMCDKKYLAEKYLKSAADSSNDAHHVSVQMIKSLRHRKPEWPFDLHSIVMDVKKSSQLGEIKMTDRNDGGCNPEELSSILIVLSDTLIAYISPEKLLNTSTLLKSKQEEFMPPDCEDEKEVMKSLIGWILEDDSDNAELMMDLINTLEKVYRSFLKGPVNESEQIEYESVKIILQVINGDLLKGLSKDDICSAFKKMCDKKYMAEKNFQKAVETSDDVHQLSIQMIKSLRLRKADWPFELQTIVQDLKNVPQLKDKVYSASIGERLSSKFSVLNSSEDINKNPSCKSDEKLCIPSTSKIDGLDDRQPPKVQLPEKNSSDRESVMSFGDTLSTSFSELSPSDDPLIATNPGKIVEQMEVESSASVSEMDVSVDQEDSVDKLTKDAGKFLKMAPTLSSKFSELGGAVSVNKMLKEDAMKHMTDFSDESEEEYEEPNETKSLELPMRGYQTELAANALAGQNTIICAPTGSGKTRVAIHIIREHLNKQEGGNAEEDQEDKKPKRKVAFLARTVPLVMQQYKSLKHYLPSKYEIESLTGDSEYSADLHKFVDHYDVFVLTPRILENHVKLFPNQLATFSLLVFDECHHTRKGEAYNTLMFSYLMSKKQGQRNLPQIVGLTASIGIEKANNLEKAKDSILEICGNLDAESISTVKIKENVEELKQLVPVPTEEIKPLKERDSSQSPAVKKILEIINQLETNAESHVKELNDDKLIKLLEKKPSDNKKSQKYGQWVVQMEKAAQCIKRQKETETNKHVRALITIAKHLKAYNVALETYELVQLRDVMKYLDDNFRSFTDRRDGLTCTEETCYKFFEELVKVCKTNKDKENPNLTLLKNIIKENLIGKDGMEQDSALQKSKGIVFVQTRALAHALVSWLRRKPGNLGSLGVEVFTGTAATEDQGGMTQRQQEEVIEDFRQGNTRLIVATTVAEEGIDIPDCNLVIKYNHVGNEITTVQTRGRSRKKGGKSYLLALNKIKKELKNQYDAKMMNAAVLDISNRASSEICERNTAHQDQIMVEYEIEQISKSHVKETRKMREPFKMVCIGCRQVIVESEDIKIIEGSHHIVANKDFLDNKVDKRPYRSLQVTEELTICAAAYCLGKPEPQATCGNKLGSVMIFKKIPFVVLSVKSFMFEVDRYDRLLSYNSWKDVHFSIPNFNWTVDIKRYWTPHKKEVGQDSNQTADSITSTEEDQASNKDIMEKKRSHSVPDRDSNTDRKRSYLSNDDSVTREKVVDAQIVPVAATVGGRGDSGFISQIGHAAGAEVNPAAALPPFSVPAEGHAGSISTTDPKMVYSSNTVPKDVASVESPALNPQMGNNLPDLINHFPTLDDHLSTSLELNLVHEEVVEIESDYSAPLLSKSSSGMS